MNAILVHGMGRTPASQLVLARRLRRAGFKAHLFGYSTLHPFGRAVSRLAHRANSLSDTDPFLLIGHSLGCVIIRAALPRLSQLPLACFLLAPPSKVAMAARLAVPRRLYRLFTTEAGQLLADDKFMQALPVPSMPTMIYAGVAGPRGRLSPFGSEENDGILAVSETLIDAPNVTLVRVPSLHTFIMNSSLVASEIVASTETLLAQRLD